MKNKGKMGFEPMVFHNTLVFKTNALNHSAIYPKFINEFLLLNLIKKLESK